MADAPVETYLERLDRLDREVAQSIKDDEAAASQAEIDAIFTIITPTVPPPRVVEPEVAAPEEVPEKRFAEGFLDRGSKLDAIIDAKSGDVPARLKNNQHTDNQN